MKSKSLALAFAALLSVLPACGPREDLPDETAAADESAGAGAADSPGVPGAAGAGTAADDGGATPTAGSTAATAPAAAPAVGTVLASQETNWAGVVVEVTEFRRKGNTLTAKFRVRNQGSARMEPDFYFSQIYVMDPAGGKKYEVLQDESGNYIGSLRSGWRDRWYDTLEAGQSAVLWAKFPAPPAEVTAVTFQLPSTPPFDDLAIQDF